MAINFRGYLFQDDGDAVNGATVQLLETGTTTVEASTTTDSNGLWYFNEGDQDRYDVKITSGTSVRYIRWDDQISLKEIDIRNNTGNTTPAATFTNLTNNAANQVAVFSGANTTRADDDEIYTSFKLANSAAELIEYGRMTVVAKDVTDGTEDGQIEFDVMKAGTLTKVWTITSSDAAAMSFDMNVDSLTIGSGADTDISLTFDANTADGVITWMEDEDYFQFSDDILMSTTERINLRDTAIYLYSSADGQADLVADTTIQVTAPTVNIEASTAITLESDSITFGEAGDTDIVLNFNANTADGVITWMEDEDYFQFSDEILMNSTEKILFGDTATFIHQSSDGVMTIDGEATIDLNASTAVLVSNDLKLNSDSSVLGFGADNDTTLTHTDGTGLTLNSTNKLTFGDTGTFIHQSSDGVLTITSDTTVDINGAVAFDGDLTGITALTVDDIVVDGKVITMTGSASDTAVFTAGTNGTLSIVTTDAAAAAANIQITADGTAELAGTTVTLDSAGDIELEATNDINVPTDVGITFGDDGEKIEGDGTNLTIASSAQLKLNSVNEVHTIDSGDLFLDIAGGDMVIRDVSGPTNMAKISHVSSDLVIQSTVQDKDIIFKQNDGGTEGDVTALTLDGSAGGAATFGGGIANAGTIAAGTWNGTAITASYIAAAQTNITSLGTLTTLTVDDITINGSTISDGGDFTLDVDGDITIDANGGQIKFADNGNYSGALFNVASASDTAAVMYSRVGDPNTGMYMPADDTIGFVTAGSEAVKIIEDGVLINYQDGILDTGLTRVEANTSVAALQVGSLGNDGCAIFSRFSADTNGFRLKFLKSRAAAYTTTPSDSTRPSANDQIGQIWFGVDDGTDNTNVYANTSARIVGEVDGTIAQNALGHDADGINAVNDNDTPGRLTFHTTPDASGSPSERMRINSHGSVLIGDTSNAFQLGSGLTVSLGTNDDEAIALKATDFGGTSGDGSGHDMTGDTESDTFGTFKKSNNNQGGLRIGGYGSATRGLQLVGSHTTDVTSKDTDANSHVVIRAETRDGTGTTTPGSDANILTVRGPGSTVRFIWDIEGSAHADVEWTTYDKEDDLGLVKDMEQELLLREDEGQTERRKYLEKVGIIGKNSWHMEKGKQRAMINTTKLSMLHHGALIQVAEKLDRLSEENKQLRQKLEALEV